MTSHRTLHTEPLEPRHLLAITVDTLVDEADGSIEDGDISLRDAIAAAKGGETIDFAAGTNGVIELDPALGELLIDKPLTIDGPGSELITIDAQQNSRVVKVDDSSDETALTVMIRGLTLTGGHADGDGGGLHSQEETTLEECVITNNFTAHDTTDGSGGAGGGVFSSGTLTVVNCEITENISGDGNEGDGGNGGGIAAFGTTSIYGSIIANNSTGMGASSDVREELGSGGDGGGIWSRGELTVVASTISGNATGPGGTWNDPDPKGRNEDWPRGSGGGISGNLTLIDSMVLRNRSGDGGGILGNGTILRSTIASNEASSYSGEFDAVGGGLNGSILTIESSTISGNVAYRGGGIYGCHDVSVNLSTITANSSGVDGYCSSGVMEVFGSIISGNKDGDAGGGSSQLPLQSLGYNLIGTGLIEAFTQEGDVAGVEEPGLALLADNGGHTRTHALLPGSPAIDAGDPDATEGKDGVPLHDQRGEGFDRVGGGRADIGAFEVQVIDGGADFDNDGDVDGVDFLTWLIGYGRGENDATSVDGDANGDGLVNGDDFLLWQAKFNSGSGAAAAEPVELANLQEVRRVDRVRWQLPAFQDHQDATLRTEIQDEALAGLKRLRTLHRH